MASELATKDNAITIEQVLVSGNLASLDPTQRLEYYGRVCTSLGLNPMTKPFEYLTLNGKLTLYARRDCTDQLRRLHNVSVTIKSREQISGVFVVTANATLPNGRTDESVGAVAIEGLKGDALANALMKAETKSKRRVTLSICGLGMLDETEIETIPHDPPAPQRSTPAKQSKGDENKKAFQRAAKKWSGVGSEDLLSVCNTIAKRHGHGSAKDLSERDYGILAAFCDESMAASVDWMQYASESQ